MRRIFAPALLGMLFAAVGSASAQEAAAPSVDEIVHKANYVAYYQGLDGRARVSMTITDGQGRERKKLFTILRRNVSPEGKTTPENAADQMFYVYFFLPPDERNTAFMVHKHVDRDDDRWLYLPALDLVKQIASTEKRTSFVGSNFFYEDVSGRNLDADTHELEQTTNDYFVIKNTPKDPASVEFAYYRMWIHRATFVTVKVEYVDSNGEKYREYAAEEVKTLQNFPTVTQSTMKDLRSGGKTTLNYLDVKYDVGIPEDVFTERYLRIPPQEYLK
jgi:outer membrane lipoprotein-sorting protein